MVLRFRLGALIKNARMGHRDALRKTRSLFPPYFSILPSFFLCALPIITPRLVKNALAVESHVKGVLRNVELVKAQLNSIWLDT